VIASGWSAPMPIISWADRSRFFRAAQKEIEKESRIL
jgi:hypothetical protein